MAGFVEGDDDTFMVMLFAVVASVCSLLLVEFCFFYRAYMHEFQTTVGWLQQCLSLTSQPNTIRLGREVLQNNVAYRNKFILPLFKRIFARWRWIMWILCFVLFVIVAQQKLSFDPHGTLGVAPDADKSVIKKAYRLLSRKYHPDVNKTEEAKVLYDQVKKAYKYLENPDDLEATNDGTTYKQGIGLPFFLTKPEYAAYSMTALLLVLFSAPFYLLFWLTKKDEGRNAIPLMKSIGDNMAMAEPFFEMLGQPRNPDLLLEEKERPRLLRLVKNVQSASGFEQPHGEVPIPALDVFTHFRPDIATFAEMWHLLNDVTAEGIKPTTVKESDNRLRDNNIFVSRDNSYDVQKELQREKPTEEEVAQAKALRERRSKGQFPVEEVQYNLASDEAKKVAMYFLDPLLNQILREVYTLYPRMDNSPRDMTQKLQSYYSTRIELLSSLKKHATEKGVSSFDASNKEQTNLLNRALAQEAQAATLAFDLIGEMRARTKASMKAYNDKMKGDLKGKKKK
eukprot:TRINITY_DN66073_c0_g1_i1.p1 TRINITY_DN66073_c0_g1~~TRINITY_DN66073_c0_g1_i1.p1  ORF type:complete len:510 (+),score=181.06 TRINITY_DN66073_c0_g1_i1:67-1596(+)